MGLLECGDHIVELRERLQESNKCIISSLVFFQSWSAKFFYFGLLIAIMRCSRLGYFCDRRKLQWLGPTVSSTSIENCRRVLGRLEDRAGASSVDVTEEMQAGHLIWPGGLGIVHWMAVSNRQWWSVVRREDELWPTAAFLLPLTPRKPASSPPACILASRMLLA